jgi:hypothetical protein
MNLQASGVYMNGLDSHIERKRTSKVNYRVAYYNQDLE